MARPTVSEHERLGRLLRQIRTDAHLSQAEIATRLGRPQSFVSKYESGERHLDFLEVREVCRAIGIPFERFVRRFQVQVR